MGRRSVCLFARVSWVPRSDQQGEPRRNGNGERRPVCKIQTVGSDQAWPMVNDQHFSPPCNFKCLLKEGTEVLVSTTTARLHFFLTSTFNGETDPNCRKWSSLTTISARTKLHLWLFSTSPIQLVMAVWQTARVVTFSGCFIENHGFRCEFSHLTIKLAN